MNEAAHKWLNKCRLDSCLFSALVIPRNSLSVGIAALHHKHMSVTFTHTHTFACPFDVLIDRVPLYSDSMEKTIAISGRKCTRSFLLVFQYYCKVFLLRKFQNKTLKKKRKQKEKRLNVNNSGHTKYRKRDRKLSWKLLCETFCSVCQIEIDPVLELGRLAFRV